MAPDLLTGNNSILTGVYQNTVSMSKQAGSLLLQMSPSLTGVIMGYVKRFSEEHGYRFDKQRLLWEKPHLRTPAQFERWSHIVAIVRNHLVLARDLVEA